MIPASQAIIIAGLRCESDKLFKQATMIEFDAQDLSYQADEIESQYEELDNNVGDKCLPCKWLYTKDTIDWNGACGKHVTIKRCISMHQCQGPEARGGS